MNDWFEVKGDSVKLVTMPAVAAILLRGDVRPGANPIIVGVPDTTVLAALIRGGPAAVSAAVDGVSAETVLTHRLAVQYEAATETAGTALTKPTGTIYSSDTGELCWDRSDPQRGYFTLSSPHNLAVTGFITSVTLFSIHHQVVPR